MKFADIQLTDQVAIVTGGGAGIGRGIALEMASVGADVVVVDNIPERAEETAARVRELGRRALAAPADVMDSEQVRAVVAKADETFGRIDILVNNAGGVTARKFLDQSERSWRRHIDLNLISMLAATHAAAPVMIRGGRGGSIINVSSIEGSRAAPRFSVYAACKAGMENFTRSMAVELAEHGIRVNCIAPDHTITPGRRGNRTGPVDPAKWVQQTPEQDAAYARLIPLGYEGDEAECGWTAVFLASKLSRYVTGVTLPVDGGTWASGGWLKTLDGQSWELNVGLSSALDKPVSGERAAGGLPDASPRGKPLRQQTKEPPMAIDVATVRKVARLARIAEPEARLASLAGELNGIIAWIEQLNEVDTDGVEPMTSAEATGLPMREDVVTDGGVPDRVLSNAPKRAGDFFVVPKVVE